MIGNTGAGKTTVSRTLSEKLAVPHVELDALFWQPAWVETPDDQFRQRVEDALRDPGWVVDGNYRSKLGTYVLDRADLTVWLDLPLRTTFSRVLRRTLRRVLSREQLWGGSTETFRNAFLRHDPLWWWAIKTHFRWRRRLPELLDRYEHVRLRSQRDVDRFLEGI